MKDNSFEDFLSKGLKYPWKDASRLWNILWIIIPIFGWFALIGYFKVIVLDLIHGKSKSLPKFGSFWHNFKQGVIICVFLIPTLFALFFISLIPIIGNMVALLFQVFLLPWLMMNFFVKENFVSLWELEKAFNKVFDHGKEYIIAYLQTLIFVFIYTILSFVLVGIPCLCFGSMFFLTDFFRKYGGK